MSIGGVGRRALLGSAILIALALGGSLWVLVAGQRQTLNENLVQEITSTAVILRDLARQSDPDPDVTRLGKLAQTLLDNGTYTVLATTDGRFLVDTTHGPEVVHHFLERAEVRQALREGTGTTTIRLSGRRHDSRVVTLRIGEDQPWAVLWLAREQWSMPRVWQSLGDTIVAIIAIALCSTIGLAFLLTRLHARLLQRLVHTARDLATGDLSARADVSESNEFTELSLAINRMRNRLAQQVETIDQQRLTLESLVDQLHEGVIVARSDGRIALLNPAAARLLNLPSDADGNHAEMTGLPIERCIPQHELQAMLRSTAEQRDSHGETLTDEAGDQEARLQIDAGNSTIHLLARASDVHLPETGSGADRPSPGRMLVLTDITELTRIIRVKSDFVANASHELRTPLTAIRAAIETLLQMDLADDAPAARRFLEAINRQSTRLRAMVSDLLDLSRLEAPSARFEPEALRVQEVLDDLRERFSQRLEARAMDWQTHCPTGRSQMITAHPHLLRLVLDNLVDNAIKFTEPGGRIEVHCAVSPGWASFKVSDNGCGIPDDQQQRVFERFYQVERARSGDERGTGLGLSIIRHAVAAMRGTVDLQSAPGEGTRVTVRLPQPENPQPVHRD